ncbi:hypothetical protein [Yoonia vestfoldensis]|uniref:hypothetical protein n=1 Tax=Yoonia vestfoldensis TaxID=245188 RepID=UPI00039A1012|nr:hypothetical protein [Yoonia vestfoldensis]
MKAYFSMVNGLSRRPGLLQTTALAGFASLALGALPVAAQVCDPTIVPLAAGCVAPNAGVSVAVPVQANTEILRNVPVGGFGAEGFSISIDNRTIAGAPVINVPQRTSDLVNTLADIDVRFDGLDTRRLLNLGIPDGRSTFRAGETVTFRSSTNYPGYITRAEIVVRDRSRSGAPVVAQLPVAPNGTADFVMPADTGSDLTYALRVYDAAGRFDETRPLILSRTESSVIADTTGAAPFPAIGEGDDNTGRRGIPVRGGVITTSGTATPGSRVTVMGEAVPVDPNGRFVVSRVVPPGDQIVTVNVNGRDYVRDVEIPRSEWFYVGIADLTLGLREGGANDEDWQSYTNGRLAFYAKGTTERGWTITSSADTRNGPIEDMFSRLNDKDPRRVIDRIRSDGTDLFPTYGDDSSYYDDTPTSGAIYLRAENETSRFTLGNFRTGIAGPGLINNARDLYGVEAQYRSPDVTSHGEPRLSAMAYAAQLETAAQRDILRGTGGSVYFLTRQDITGGSTTVTVQEIDPDTGFVIGTRLLTEGTDYRVDHIQGVIILTAPLTGSAGDGGLVNSGAGDNNVNLVVQYEYTPTDGLSDANAFGGRAEVWVTDDLRLGGSVMSETASGGADQRVAAIDLRYRLGETSHAELEIARTDGPGFTRSVSQDGGLTIASTGGATNDAAQAVRFTSLLDLRELGMDRDGAIGLRYEQKDAGFSTLNEDITEDQTLLGLDARVDVTDRLSLALDTTHFTKDGGEEKTEAEVSVGYALTDVWTVEAGVQVTDKATPGDPAETGDRTDLGLKLSYSPSDDLSVYVFGQATVDVGGGLSDNNRLGFGADLRVTDNLTMAGEISDGDTGVAGKLQLSYTPSADNEIYLGYTLDPTRANAGDALSDHGRVVLGGRFRQSDTVSTYAENIYDMPGNQRSLTQAYGVTYSPTDVLTYSLGMETGTIRDSATGDFDRTAFSIGAAYSRDEDLSIRGRLEYRTEDGAGDAQDRETIGLTAGYSNKVAQDWRVLANLDALYSDSATGDFRDGEYLRASLGYAYRPIDNERLNLLVRVTALNDLPGEDQVDANGNSEGPQQRSAVLAVSGSYDLNRHLTLGGKFAHRVSEIADRGSDDFTANTASLAILRADWHVVDQWDIMAEGRVSFTAETDIAETGALLGVYRHINDNVKVGVGYEWGAVSAEETDLDYDGQGVFLNLVGKF